MFTKSTKIELETLLHGEVYQIWKREILVLDDDGNELILPKLEQIPRIISKKGIQLELCF